MSPAAGSARRTDSEYQAAAAASADGGYPMGMAGAMRSAPSPETEEVQPFVMTADMMNQLMRENPNNMTHALRTWMSRGAEKSK